RPRAARRGSRGAQPRAGARGSGAPGNPARPVARRRQHLAGCQAARGQPPDAVRPDAPAQHQALTEVDTAPMSKRSTKHGRKATLIAGLAALLLTSAAAPSIGATSEEEKSNKFYREAQEYMKKRDVNAAVIQLKNALKADAGNVAARMMLADIYNRLG